MKTTWVLAAVMVGAVMGAAPAKKPAAKPPRPATRPAATAPATPPPEAEEVREAKARAVEALAARSEEYRDVAASLPTLQANLTSARAGSDTAAKMEAGKAYNDARQRATAMEAAAIAADPGVKAAREHAAAEEKAKTEAASAAMAEAERAIAKRRERGTNWKDYLKVGMSEAEANDLFDAIPRVEGTYLRKGTESVTAQSKTVVWKMDVMQYHTVGGPSGGYASVPAGSKTFRMCTITFEDGKVTAIDY
jgi:hypothetical protein